MVVIGLWLSLVGYGVLYAGVQKLGGRTCTFGDAFAGRCGSGAATQSAPGTSSGVTLLSSLQAQRAQQGASVPSTPIPVAA